MRILVTGSTGVLGRRVVPLLTAAGHTVTAAVRSPAKAQRLVASGAAIVAVRGFDKIADLVSGHDAVINLATSIPTGSKGLWRHMWQENDRIRSRLSAALVDAALRSGCSRFIQESIALVYADGGDRWITEDAPLDAPPHAQSALVAESHVQRFTEAGRTGVVLRFGLFYAADTPHTRDALRFARKGFASIFGSKRDYFPPIQLDDAATAVVQALTIPAGIYNVVDNDPPTRGEYARVLREVVGAKKTPRVPGKISALLMGSVARSLARSQRVSNQKLRATGWHPRYATIKEGLPQVAKQMR